ncbi:VOC family protein [Sphingosinicella terrae]|uniref:VOC family protein n=1 Tax=Sphingosinicella terrae TaxID=2172047 RepID=UPI0013B386AA|nr:VOC family protein [Sphingosinicella terrae]
MNRRTVLGGLAAGLVVRPALATTGERPTRIRHYVLATREMNFVCDQIYEVLGLAPLQREGPSPTETYGFYSTMMKIGTTMLEVVEPMRPDHHLNQWLDERGGDGGYMVVMQTFNSEALKARAAAEGLTLTRDLIFRGQHMLQFDYRHFGTHFEFYQYSPPEDWWGDPNGRPYPLARVATEIVGAEVAVEDPQAIAAQAARLFGAGDRDGTRLNFEDRALNFVPSRGNWRGLVALDLRARDQTRGGDWARIGGITFRFV